MSLVLPAVVAVLAACCGWPASHAVHAYADRTVSPLVMAMPMLILACAAAVWVHPSLTGCAAAWLAACSVPLATIDAVAFRLPDPLTGAAFAGVAVFLIAASGLSGDWHALAMSAAGAGAMAGLFLLLALARPGSAGLGDAKLGLSLGALTAWTGWSVLLAALLAAFLLAACYGLWLLASGRASMRTRLPFGPFLLAGSLLAVMLASAG